MNKLKIQPEQAVMAVVLVLFGLGLAFLAFSLPPSEEVSSKTVGAQPAKIAFDKLELISEQMKTPLLVDSVDKKNPVFVSRLIVYAPASGEIGPLDETKEIKGVEITPAWLIANRLSIEDPNVGNQDPDNDGFSNLEEYKGKTNPQDKNAHPPIIAKLAMKKYNSVPFNIQFKGRVQGADGLQFQVAFKDRSKLYRKGDAIEDYVIGEYREKIVEEYDPSTKEKYKKDVSELDLVFKKLNDIIVLVLNKKQESDESTVEFVLRVPGGKVDPSTVKRGDTFKVRESTYQLIKANANGAVIQDVNDTNKENTIAVPVLK